MLRTVHPPDAPPTIPRVRFVQRFGGNVVRYEVEMFTRR